VLLPHGQCQVSVVGIIDVDERPTSGLAQAKEAPGSQHVILRWRVLMTSRERDTTDWMKHSQLAAGAGHPGKFVQPQFWVFEMRQEARGKYSILASVR
jgi:hypothetical protein